MAALLSAPMDELFASYSRPRPRRDYRDIFRRYVTFPFVWASAAALFMAGYVVFRGVTGYRGKNQPAIAPVSLSEAWEDVPELAGLIFVVTFLVLAVKARVWPWE